MTSLIQYFSADLIIHLIFFQLVMLFITIWNIHLARRARRHMAPAALPRVSILVPARDEENNIATCALSLLKQDYPDFEVIILNDHSTDRTGSILADIQRSWPQLSVIPGQPSPANQIGKNWACSQLFQKASGDLLLFTDADTIHHPLMLRKTVAALLGEGADMITGYPKQILGSFGESLLVPFFSWAILVLFPLGLAYNIRSPIFTTAVGQLMLFRREAYQQIGGHEGVSSSIVDDLSLAREIHTAGLTWRTVFVADLISCRMYRTSQEASEGFAKNLFAAFEFRLLPFLFAFIWLAILFLEPLLILILKTAGMVPFAQTRHLVICILLSNAIWVIPYLHHKLPVWLALFYPITIAANVISAFRSLLASLQGKLVWKNRVIQPSNWKWF
jgi:chlorobactene glucosyltransferase